MVNAETNTSATADAISECGLKNNHAHDSAATSNLLAGLINLSLVSMLLPLFWQAPEWEHLPALLSLGVMGMCGHQLLTLAFRHATPALLAPFSYGQLVIAGLFGWLFYGDTIVLSAKETDSQNRSVPPGRMFVVHHLLSPQFVE